MNNNINKYISEAMFDTIKPSITPVKGIDYYTETDKEEIVELVLNALPAAEKIAF